MYICLHAVTFQKHQIANWWTPVMLHENLDEIFSETVLNELLPPGLTDEFFEALYGDAKEGAYDLSLSFNNYDPEQKVLTLDFKLNERPGKCLACNLTYGLPQVFSCHPLINIKGMVKKITRLLGDDIHCTEWKLGHTETPAAQTHIIPLIMRLA